MVWLGQCVSKQYLHIRRFFVFFFRYFPIQYPNKKSINRASKRIALVIARAAKLSNKFLNPKPEDRKSTIINKTKTGRKFVGIIHLPNK